MRRRTFWKPTKLAVAFSLCAGPGCGSDGENSSGARAGSAGIGASSGAAGTSGRGDSGGQGGTGGTAGTSSGGTTGMATGGTTGTGTGGTAGATDAGASGAAACASGWGDPRVLLRVPGGVALTSPTLSPDELEVLYGQTQGSIWQFRRSVRDSLDAPFAAGEVVAELETMCSHSGQQRLSIDLSADGLTAYLVCSSLPPYSPSAQVRVARRPRIGATFVVDAADYGQTGPDFSISADELTGYAAAIPMQLPPDLPLPPDNSSPRLFTRPAKSATFGVRAGRLIPGLETVPLVAPDPSSDGRWLFGANGHIVVAWRERLDAPFGAPSVAIAGDFQASIFLRDPEVSRDCRRLYYVQQEPGPPPAYGTFGLRVAVR